MWGQVELELEHRRHHEVTQTRKYYICYVNYSGMGMYEHEPGMGMYIIKYLIGERDSRQRWQ